MSIRNIGVSSLSKYALSGYKPALDALNGATHFRLIDTVDCAAVETDVIRFTDERDMWRRLTSRAITMAETFNMPVIAETSVVTVMDHTEAPRMFDESHGSMSLGMNTKITRETRERITEERIQMMARYIRLGSVRGLRTWLSCKLVVHAVMAAPVHGDMHSFSSEVSGILPVGFLDMDGDEVENFILDKPFGSPVSIHGSPRHALATRVASFVALSLRA